GHFGIHCPSPLLSDSIATEVLACIARTGNLAVPNGLYESITRTGYSGRHHRYRSTLVCARRIRALNLASGRVGTVATALAVALRTSQEINRRTENGEPRPLSLLSSAVHLFDIEGQRESGWR